ncbi:MAG TPA: amylo-alpha-1,6-glucosidase [Terriglobales bacterium]|nr:amylo-alpha-1,6-glucosidase [Terriglobales bacterium]
MEAWVYPLKILSGFHLMLHLSGSVIPAASLARTITVRPESSSILYASDEYQIRETLIVPVHESGAMVLLETETSVPLEIEAVFERDFQLEWPAGLGGSDIDWDPNLRAFSMEDERKKFAALIGSPSAALARQEYFSNYSASRENSFLLGRTAKGKETKLIVLAASMNGSQEAEETFHRITRQYSDLWHDSAEYYRQYLNQTVSLELPDSRLQQAYDWARISILQGMVSNPYLGTGLVAGYRASESDERPGFAWFFGRDALWTAFALNAEGAFARTRTALDFLSHYQRADGKIPHEMAQTASLVPWFQDYPFAFASADATPLYLVTVDDYVRRSGDLPFATEKWDSLWKAYQFLKSTYGPHGLPQNLDFGHGWVEGGPFVPVESELYQSSLGTQALRALADLAHLIGKEDLFHQLQAEFAHQTQLLNQTFWSKEKGLYAFALDQKGQRSDFASVLATTPMWFDLLDPTNAEAMIDQLASSGFQTDWGMRIVSSSNPMYSPGGYHYGSVWPLFTGWAAVAEYRYHRTLPAYLNLLANALLTLDGSLGHVTEVLSGDYYQPLSTSSPHQVWSAAMVVSPVLRGMFGLESDSTSHQLRFAPHLPAEWKSFAIHNLQMRDTKIDLDFQRTEDEMILGVRQVGSEACTLDFSPSLSPRAEILGAELNGRPAPMQVEHNSEDQHVSVRFTLEGGRNIVRIHLRNDFGIGISANLPPLGERSQGLRIVSETWNPQSMIMNVSGIAGHTYELSIWNPKQLVQVDGAEISKHDSEISGIRISIPKDEGSAYVSEKIVFHFSPVSRDSKEGGGYP